MTEKWYEQSRGPAWMRALDARIKASPVAQTMRTLPIVLRLLAVFGTLALVIVMEVQGVGPAKWLAWVDREVFVFGSAMITWCVLLLAALALLYGYARYLVRREARENFPRARLHSDGH